MRQEALILDTDHHWARFAARVLGSMRLFQGITAPEGLTLSGIRDLSSRDWGFVLMDSIDSAVDQRIQLEGLAEWVSTQNHENPLLVVSYIPTPILARDAMGLGATSYDRKSHSDVVLKEQVKHALRMADALAQISPDDRMDRFRRQQYLERFQHLTQRP